MIVDKSGRPLRGADNKSTQPVGVKMMRSYDAFSLSTTPDWTRFHGRNMLTHGFERNIWVYRCSVARQNSAAEADLVVQTKDREEDGEWSKDEEHRINAVLEAPCPGLGRSDLVKMIVAQLDIQGAFYAKIAWGGPGGRYPLEIWPLEIGSVGPVVRNNELIRFEYTPRGRSTEKLDPQDVLAIRMTHPDSPYHGMPPMLAAGRSVDMDNEAADWQKTSMQNRGVPDGVFELTGEVGPDEYREAKRSVRETFTGRTSAREPYVMAGAKFHQMSLTPVEVDFINSRKLTREEICAAYGVPLPIAGVLEDATLANLEASRRVFWRDTMVPLLADIQSQMSRQLIRDRGVRIRFDTSMISALAEAFGEKLENARKLWEMGVPLDKVNQRVDLGLDLEDLPGAGQSWVATGVSPAGDSSNDSDVSLVGEIATAVHEGKLGRNAAAKLLSRKVDWLSEADALELLVEADEGAADE